MKRRSRVLFASICLIVVWNCGNIEKPSRATLRHDFEKILGASNTARHSTVGKFDLVEVNKTNAVDSVEAGVPIYTAELDVTLKCTQSGFPPPGLNPSAIVMTGDVYVGSGRLRYEKTENGWRPQVR